MIKIKKVQLYISVIILSLLLFGCGIPKQDDFTQTIDSIDESVPELLNKYKTSGAALALVHNGEVIWKNAYGFADKAQGIKITPSTVFQAASISKPVTAWAVMKLVEEGKLDLDTPVEKYLTRWHLPSTRFDTDDVTVRRLLSHTSGLSLGGFRGIHPDQSIPTLVEALSGNNSSNNTVVRFIKKPGSVFYYSGGGYMVLSLLVEEVTGELFEDYIQREILQPLGMINSSYKWNEAIKLLTAKGYDRNGQAFPNYLFAGKGAASLYTTAEDLAKWVAASMPGKNGEAVGRGVLKPETIEMMYTPVTKLKGGILLFYDSMGLSYLLDEINMVSHTGSNRGWRNVFAFLPETGDGLVVLTNSERGQNVYVDVMNLWSNSIIEETPKICNSFNKIFLVSAAISIMLFLGLVVFIIRNIRRNPFIHRRIFWKQNIPLRRKILRFIIQITLPTLFTYVFYLVLYVGLSYLSPLTSSWLIFGLISWNIVAVVTAIFPRLVK